MPDRHYEDAETLIPILKDRMMLLDGKEINATTITSIVQTVFDMLVLADFQQGQIRALEAGPAESSENTDYETREIRQDPSDGNAYVLRQIRRVSKSEYYVEISDIMGRHQTIVSLIDDWLKWDYA